MKKVLFSLLMLVGMGIAVNAQVKVNWDGPYGIDFKLKRCYVQGKSCVIDFIATNNTGKDISIRHTEVAAYDDEANQYKISSSKSEKGFYYLESSFGDKDFSGWEYSQFPQGTSLKGRMIINSFDEFAAVITVFRMKFSVVIDGKNSNGNMLEIRDIPVSRE